MPRLQLACTHLTHRGVQVHAGFLLLSGVCRAARRLNESSLFATLSGAAFIFSSECPIRAAEDVGSNPAAYALGVLAIATLGWAGVTHITFSVAAPHAEQQAAGAPEQRRMRKLAARAEYGPAEPGEDDAAQEDADV